MTLDDTILGIDIGGTGCKAGVYSLTGDCLGKGYTEYSMISTVPGQAEHDAEGWWQALIKAVRSAIAEINPSTIRAIGVSCTNGLIAVDDNGLPIRPAIMLWDQRALPEVDRIQSVLGSEVIQDITGNPGAPGAYSLPTILWLKHKEPETFQKAHKFMVPGGYIVARLTGEFTIDYSRASTTLLFDIRKREWHRPFLDALEIPEEKLPQPVASQSVVGYVTKAAGALTGLQPGTPVIAGCMDSLSAAIGSNSTQLGDYFIIMGTAARVCVPLTDARFDPRFMNCTGIEDDTWLAIGAINGVGSSLRWARDVIALDEQRQAYENNEDVYDVITAKAALSPPGSKGLIFLPYLSGERTPIWDPYARGIFWGLTLGHSRSDVFRSMLEGPAFAMRHTIEILARENKIPVKSLRIGGAAATSTVWNQIIADVLGVPLVTVNVSHIEVLGAAILAGYGVGVYSSLEDGLKNINVISEHYTPNEDRRAVYNRLFPFFLEMYPVMKPYFKQIVDLNLPQGWIR